MLGNRTSEASLLLPVGRSWIKRAPNLGVSGWLAELQLVTLQLGMIGLQWR